MKNLLRFSLLALLMTVFNGAWATETPYKTLQFGPAYNSQGVSSYASTWSATYDNFTCTIVNFNNNNNGWSVIKGGSKNGTWDGSIITAAAIDKAVTKVVVTVDAVKNSNGSLLEVADNAGFTNSTTIPLTPVAGDNTYTITSPIANAYYRLTFNQKKGSSNGDLTISKIVFYTESEGPHDANVTISANSIEVGETATISYPEGLVVSFVSGNSSIASVDAQGVVTGEAEGETTISASWDATNEYNQGQTVFNLTVTAAIPATTYEKVTNTNQLVAGNEYILVATASNMAMGAVNSTNDKIRDKVPVTITDDNKVSIKNEAVTVLTLGGENGAWTFLASDNNKYLALNSPSNEIHASDEVTDNAKWTVTNDFELKDDTYSRYLRYNSGNPRFACYSSGQQSAVLFVKEGSAVGKTPVASSCTITPTEVEVGTSGSFDAAIEANFNGLDLTDWSSDHPEVLSVNGSYYEAHQVGTVTVTFNCKPMEGVEGWENYEAVAFTQTVTVYDPNAKGTINNPYTVAEALALTELPTNDVYVTGIISQIDEVSTQHGNASYWISDDGTTDSQLKIYHGKYLDGADFTAEDQITVGDGVKVCGKLSVYQGANQFGANNSKIVELSHKTPVASSCAITPTEVEVGTSGSFDAAIEANFNGLDLTDWSSDNPEVLSVNGSYYEAHQVGTVTVTFNCKPMEGVEGWENYAPVAFTQTVTVYDPNAPTEVTATFDATKDIATTGDTRGEWSITKDGLTIYSSDGIGGNETEYRLYKFSTFTVSSTVGKIKKIEFTDKSGYAVSNFSELDGWDASTKTWTGSANKVTFTASGAQVRLALVKITYEPAFILSDLLNEKTPYTNDEDKQVPMVIYKREFSSKTAGHRQCWFVPFDYTITDEDLERCTFYRIHMFSAEADQEGVVQDENKVVMKIVEVTSGYTLSANKPYIIKPKTAGVYEFVAENTTLKARDTGSLKYTSTSTNRYDFYGVYNSYSSDVAKQWFSLNTNGNLLWNAAGQTLGAYRWYITSTYTGDDYANIVFVIDEDSEGDETTAIEQLFNNPNAEIEGLYTVDGIKLYKPAKGLNIVKYTDGRTKKVYIK